MIGRTVSHYEILEQLGAGGMGVVYKARDSRLGRIVALKFLPPQLGDEEMRQRFLREAQAASTLDHPSICTVHDIDETEDGSLFIVMGYYAGETLRRRLDEAPPSVDEALHWGARIADGLAAAHARGIVHRDVKPANVLVTSDGDIKILDFGLAKVLGTTQVTRTGTTLGTLAYMAPEQLAAREVDARADVWALGALVTEMLTGRSPFAGPSEGAVVYNILHRDIPPISQQRPGLSPELDRILGRCLEREAARRYATARELADELDRLATASSGSATRSAPVPAGEEPTRIRHDTVDSVAAPQPSPEDVTAVAGEEARPADALAVLDFVNYSGQDDIDWLSGGIAESVTVDLKKLVAIGILSRGRVAQAVATRGGPPADDAAARELGAALGARWLVWGGFQRAGEALRITAHFLDATTSEPVGSVKLDGSLDQIFDLQDRIIDSLADSFDVALSDTRQHRLQGPRTDDLEAFEYCARGRQIIWRLDPSKFDEAKQALEKATEIDPTYALAYSGLGQLHSMRFITTTDPEDLEVAIQNLRRACELDEELADPHLWLAYDYARLRRFEEAIRHGRRAVELDPDESMGHYFLGVAHWLRAMLEHDGDSRIEALRHLLRTVELAPRDQPAHQIVGDLYKQLGLYDRAAAAYRRAVAIEESGEFQNARFVGSHSVFGILALHRGDLETAEASLRRGRDSLDEAEHVYAKALLTLTLCALGELALRRRSYDVALHHYREAARCAEANPHALGIGWFRILSLIGQARAFDRLSMRIEARSARGAALDLLEGERGAYDFSGIWNGGDAAVWFELAASEAAAVRLDEAVRALERAVECGWRELPRLEADPALRELQADPRTAALRAEVKRDLNHRSPRLPESGGVAPPVPADLSH